MGELPGQELDQSLPTTDDPVGGHDLGPDPDPGIDEDQDQEGGDQGHAPGEGGQDHGDVRDHGDDQGHARVTENGIEGQNLRRKIR